MKCESCEGAIYILTLIPLALSHERRFWLATLGEEVVHLTISHNRGPLPLSWLEDPVLHYRDKM
jgi:hypothetical protein